MPLNRLNEAKKRNVATPHFDPLLLGYLAPEAQLPYLHLKTTIKSVLGILNSLKF